MYEHLSSTVIHGKQLGRTLGFPTINCPLHDDTFQLPSGTYRVNVLIEGTTYRGIGPWFPDRNLFEVHLLDTNGDFYTKQVTIIPLIKVRDNMKFSSPNELQVQLQKDLQRAQEHPHTVITFGTFDHFHPGHEAYLREAKQYGDYLITVVARDTTVQRIKGYLPDSNETQRFTTLAECEYIDIVELGNSDDPYTCLRDYKPHVICLGYNQHSFDTGLRERCDANGLGTTNILRLSSYLPDKRKSSYLRTI